MSHAVTNHTPPATLLPSLRQILTLDVSVASPLEAGQVVGLNSRGHRRIIPITGGTVTSHIPALPHGKVIHAGADFQIVVSPTCADLDARYMLELDDGSHSQKQQQVLHL